MNKQTNSFLPSGQSPEGGLLLCINGSDSMGYSGVQADVRTVRDLGGYAATVITSVTVQNSQGIAHVHNLPTELVLGQVRGIYDEVLPRAVKVGLVSDPDAIRRISREVVGCPNIVCSPVINSSNGGLLMQEDAIRAFCRYLLPVCTLLVVKCVDAEVILGGRIQTDNDMLEAARSLCSMGAKHVLLRGGTYTQGRVNALLYPSSTMQDAHDEGSFFSSVNTEGWQRHGIGGTLSTAIAARLAMGDGVPEAVSNAHRYMHTQVVYKASPSSTARAAEGIYDRFMTLLSNHYTKAHDVTFYAAELCISTRYLSQVTGIVCGRSPKQVIDDYLVRQSEQLLLTTVLTIQQIAIVLGFSSQVAFAKFFKAKKGCSPSSYREVGRPNG